MRGIINLLKRIKPEYDTKLVLAAAAVSRLLLIIFMVVVVNYQSGFIERSEKSLVHWDGDWYTDVAANGYDSDYVSLPPEHLLCNSGTGFCQRNFAFFPAYPVLIRVAGEVTANLNIAAILISNISFIVASVILFKLAKQLSGRKVAYYSLLALLLWPAGYIFSGAMTESLFLVLLLAVYYSFYNKKYLLAGILGALLSATRNIGILALLPMVLIYLEQTGNKIDLKKLQLRTVLSFLLVPAGLIIFMAYLDFRTTDPFAFINIQEYWGKPVLGLSPLYALYLSLFDYRLEGGLIVHIYNLAYLSGTAFLFVWGLTKKVIPFSSLVILPFLLVPMTAGTLLSLPRYTAVLFPVYLLLGNFTKKYPKLMFFVYPVFFVSLLILSYLYAYEHWITV